MIIAVMSLEVADRRANEVIGLLKSLIGPTISREGCIDCWLSADLRDGKLYFVEEWESREGLYSHMRSSHYRKILAAMDLAVGPPVVRFLTVDKVEGFGLIQEVIESSDS